MFQLYRPAILKHFSADVKTGVFNTIVTAAIAASNFFVPLMILFPLCKKNVFEARVSIYYFITLRFFCQLIFKKMITENHICFLLIIYYFVYMVSKITALYDWLFEAQAGYTQINDFAVMIAKKAVNSFVRTPFESIQEELFLKELLDSLAMSGIANEIAGSSAPTSGSEHLISHALDKLLEQPQLHGVQVGIATYLMARVQDHRHVRVNRIFTDTGFWKYVETLGMKKEDFSQAIDMAPSIKPHRHTYLHEEPYRETAKRLLEEDEILSRILV